MMMKLLLILFHLLDRISSIDLPDFVTTQSTVPSDGWVDDSNSTVYNQYVTLPSSNGIICYSVFLLELIVTLIGPDVYNSYENLYLDASSYDLMAVVGYNDDPVVKDKGSAIRRSNIQQHGARRIFFHVASIVNDTTSNTTTLGPTAGTSLHSPRRCLYTYLLLFHRLHITDN